MINADTLRILAVAAADSRDADDWAMLFGIVIDGELWSKIVGPFTGQRARLGDFIDGFRMYGLAESDRQAEQTRRQRDLVSKQIEAVEAQLPDAGRVAIVNPRG